MNKEFAVRRKAVWHLYLSDKSLPADVFVKSFTCRVAARKVESIRNRGTRNGDRLWYVVEVNHKGLERQEKEKRGRHG